MGDADSLQILMPVEDVEVMMGNAWSDMENGLDGVFELINSLNERTSRIASEVSAWRRVSHCFTALNILVIPIVLAFWVALGRTELLALAPRAQIVESFLDSAIVVLMLISGVGLPFYIYSMFQVYVIWKQNLDPSSTSASGDVSGSPAVRKDGLDEADSYERLAELARSVNRRIMDNVRQDLAARISQAKEQPSWLVSTFSGRSELSEMDPSDSTLAQIPDELGADNVRNCLLNANRRTCRLIIIDAAELDRVVPEREEDEWIGKVFGL